MWATARLFLSSSAPTVSGATDANAVFRLTVTMMINNQKCNLKTVPCQGDGIGVSKGPLNINRIFLRDMNIYE
jgi:hypothetical protein